MTRAKPSRDLPQRLVVLQRVRASRKHAAAAMTVAMGARCRNAIAATSALGAWCPNGRMMNAGTKKKAAAVIALRKKATQSPGELRRSSGCEKYGGGAGMTIPRRHCDSTPDGKNKAPTGGSGPQNN